MERKEKEKNYCKPTCIDRQILCNGTWYFIMVTVCSLTIVTVRLDMINILFSSWVCTIHSEMWRGGKLYWFEFFFLLIDKYN